ncbi:uncharacterized protein LOC135501365 [Lineus longissimus]|uniref:uncharacterized protein LOC135501365 n=1 Tax=Lineus longissimus TaxID=88925 RepID=UPI002B4D8A39
MSAERKYSDPWQNREQASQTDDADAAKTGTETDKAGLYVGSVDTGFCSEEAVGPGSLQTTASSDDTDNFEIFDSLVASQANARSQQHGSQQPDEISDPWRREKNVIVAVDGSDHGDRALDFYLDNVHKMEYQIVLTHCANVPRIPLCDEIPREEWNTQLEDKDKSIRIMEQDYAAKLRNEGVTFTTRFFYHPKPGCGILQVAEEENAVLIVTGSRGMGRKRRTVLGSVSHYILLHSKIPVVVCPAENYKHRYHYDTASEIIKSRAELDLIQESNVHPKMRLSHEDLSAVPEDNPSPGLNRHSFVRIDI